MIRLKSALLGVLIGFAVFAACLVLGSWNANAQTSPPSGTWTPNIR